MFLTVPLGITGWETIPFDFCFRCVSSEAKIQKKSCEMTVVRLQYSFLVGEKLRLIFNHANFEASISLRSSQFHLISQDWKVSHSRPVPFGLILDGQSSEVHFLPLIRPKKRHQLYHGPKSYGFRQTLPSFFSRFVSPWLETI